MASTVNGYRIQVSLYWIQWYTYSLQSTNTQSNNVRRKCQCVYEDCKEVVKKFRELNNACGDYLNALTRRIDISRPTPNLLIWRFRFQVAETFILILHISSYLGHEIRYTHDWINELLTKPWWVWCVLKIKCHKYNNVVMYYNVLLLLIFFKRKWASNEMIWYTKTFFIILQTWWWVPRL